MDKEQLKTVKEKVYEIEGLLELLSLRPEKEEELQPMIASRLHVVCEMMEPVRLDLESESAEEKSVSVEEESESVEEEEESVEEEVEDVEDDEFYCLPDEDEDPEAEDLVAEESESEKFETEVFGPEANLTTEETRPSTGRPSGKVIPKPIFCLNDRFRFCKTLFGGSSKDFNAVIECISLMEFPEEAERHFYRERGMNPEDPEVAAFMEIVLNSFK